MPNTSSAKKYLKQNIKRNLRNKAIRSKVRNASKAFISSLVGGDLSASAAAFKTFEKQGMKAVSGGVFKKNTIARKISRLYKALVVKFGPAPLKNIKKVA